MSEGEAELAMPDLTPEPLGEQRLKVGLVINGEDFRRLHFSRRPKVIALAGSSVGRNRQVL
jgi:hypothetical protein